MRARTRGGLVVVGLCMALAGCDKDGDETTPAEGEQGNAGGTGTSAQTQRPPRGPENYYEEAERNITPQERAQRNLRGMSDTTMSYWDLREAGPVSVARTPSTVPCGDPVATNPADWEQPTWRALQFTPRDPNYYSYQYDSRVMMRDGEPAGVAFTASAFGDLDCDGTLSTFVRRGTIFASYGDMRFVGDNEAVITNRDE